MQMGSYPQPIPVNQKKHTGFGWASLILGIIAVVLVILIFVLIFANLEYMFYFIASIFGFVAFILSIIGLVFGALAYFGRHKDKIGLIGFILGVVMLVMSLIGPSLGTYFVYTSGLDAIRPTFEISPDIFIEVQDHPDNVNGMGDNLFVITHDSGETIYWDDLFITIYIDYFNEITSETNVDDLSGSFSVGDSVVISEESYENPVTESTSLTVRIIHTTSGALIYTDDIEIE